jgi:methylmalonyl-CoA mutase cobalamin-binding subunit
MPNANVIAAARLLRDEGYVVVKPEFTAGLLRSALDALAEARHKSREVQAASMIAAALSELAAKTVKSMGETEGDQMAAHDAVWEAVPIEFKG